MADIEQRLEPRAAGGTGGETASGPTVQSTCVGVLGKAVGSMTAWDREKLRGRDSLGYLVGAVFLAIGLATGIVMPIG